MAAHLGLSPDWAALTDSYKLCGQYETRIMKYFEPQSAVRLHMLGSSNAPSER